LFPPSFFFFLLFIPLFKFWFISLFVKSNDHLWSVLL
jgi:hypothetical protein